MELRSIGKSFANGIIALDGFGLKVQSGEFLALLGPSGCGKSTVLRLIAGLSQPNTGEILWNDATKREVSFVFQEPTLMPWARVAANVALPLKLARLDRAEVARRVSEALEQVGLSEFARAFPRELSGGMKMRVAIARALVTRPQVLLMDEPFAALDEITRFKLNEDLARLRLALGCTVIFVTHSVYESAYLADRIVVMSPRPGRVLSDIPVPAPGLRNESFRRSPVYNQVCQKASDALVAGMQTGATS